MNFCLDRLGTSISSDCVTSEGYTAQNLLRNYNHWEWTRIVTRPGFLSDSFVRPPVKLTLTFPTCIEISHIVIHPKLFNHRQIASAFQIQTITKFKQRGQQQEEETAINFAGKEFINTAPIPEVLVFKNPRFALKRLSANLPGAEYFNHYTQYSPSFNLKHQGRMPLERVVGLELTILRTSGATIPALGALQIWGQPCPSCPKEVVERLSSQWSSILKSNPKTLLPAPLPSSEGHKRRRLSLQNPGIPIPEEFQDAITLEIMTHPLRLPCGLAIDSSTMERINSEEAVWGRVPNDPFSGSPFTENVKPIMDISLKARIDRFLTENCNDERLAKEPRILGPNLPNYGATSSFPATKIPSSSSVTTSTSSTSISNSNNYPRLHSNGNYKGGNDRLSSELSKFLSNPRGSTSSGLILQNGSLTAADKGQRGGAFEGSLGDSNGRSCLICQKSPDTNLVGSSKYSFYRGICSHICICRECLMSLDKKGSNCLTCGQIWSPSDCQKINL